MLPQRKSPRHPSHDYCSAGAYFVTIITKNRKRCFGYIEDGQMILNQLGKIVYGYWHEIPSHFHHVAVDEFVIMPDHIHGILILGDNQRRGSTQTTDRRDNGTALSSGGRRNASSLRSGYDRLSKRPSGPKGISPKPGSLSTVIGSFKSICTKMIRKKYNTTFARQSRYHDRIIRDENEYKRTQRYIRNNPKHWKSV